MRDLAPALVALLVACAPAAPTGARLVGREALEASIARDGRTVAIVSLDERDAHLHKPLVDRARLDEVAAREARFVGTLDPAHVRVRARFASVPATVVDLDGEGLRALERHGMVRAVVADVPVRALDDVSAALVGADREIAAGHDGDGVGVAVLDSGINTEHVDFAGALLGGGYHALAQGSDVGNGGIEDDDGHGTNVAGIVAGRGTVAPRGIAPGARLVVVRIITHTGGWASDWALGLDWVVAHRDDFAVPVRIVNMSIGTYMLYPACPCDDALPPLTDAVEAATASGLLVVAASGNEGSTSAITAPACISSVLAVGATYSSDDGRQPPVGTWRDRFGSEFAACFDETAPRALACFTNRNACVGMVAPGSPISSDGIGSAMATSVYHGTSQATPHVAGVAADLAAAYPSLDRDALVEALRATAQAPVMDPLVAGASYEFLDAVAADARAACLASCKAGPCEVAHCDAGGTCTKTARPLASRCGAPKCSGGIETGGRCDGHGACVDATTPCAPYACDASGTECLTRCAGDGDCGADATCASGDCVARTTPDQGNAGSAGGSDGAGGGCALAGPARARGLGLLGLALAATLLRLRPRRRRRRRPPSRRTSA